MQCSVYYIRNFYLSSRYHPHHALMPCWPVVFSLICAAFITAASEVRVVSRCINCVTFLCFLVVRIFLLVK